MELILDLLKKPLSLRWQLTLIHRERSKSLYECDWTLRSVRKYFFNEKFQNGFKGLF